MIPDDVRASRVEWITAYLKADPSLVREVLEGLGLPDYEAAWIVFELGGNISDVVDAAWRLPEEKT